MESTKTYSTVETAKKLGITPHSVMSLVYKDKLKPINNGPGIGHTQWRFTQESIDERIYNREIAVTRVRSRSW